MNFDVPPSMPASSLSLHPFLADNSHGSTAEAQGSSPDSLGALADSDNVDFDEERTTETYLRADHIVPTTTHQRSARSVGSDSWIEDSGSSSDAEE